MSDPSESRSRRSAPVSHVVDAPSTVGATLVRLGPGMIVAGSIVGSGELIATTKVGAESGFWLLWLIIIGCVIKVFAQVEFGRYTITYAQTPLSALNTVPGPRAKVNWIVWYWAFMTLMIITQQGGIVGGVGQALSISCPLTEQGRIYNQASDELITAKVDLALAKKQNVNSRVIGDLETRIEDLASRDVKEPLDAYLWATIVAVGTSLLLLVGRYRFIQTFSTIMVVGFTLVTVVTFIVLQTKPDWAVTGGELAEGLSFRFPPPSDAVKIPLATALAAFGIIGVGASELIMYPYWCLEKGYAKFAGPRDESNSWAERARGWMRVLRLDAWTSMVVYTFATVAFYLLGAAVLGRAGLNPEKGEMVRMLSEMYVPVFGPWAAVVFLVGAFAVLYSTFFVSAAGNSRIVADGLGLFGFHDGTDRTRMTWSHVISVIWPLIAVGLFWLVGWYSKGQSPAGMVLASGVAQAVMLPMLGLAAVYFRYTRCDKRLMPGTTWDILLWISFAGLTLAGGWAGISNVMKFLSGPG